MGNCCYSQKYLEITDSKDSKGFKKVFVETDHVKIGRDVEGRKLINSYCFLRTLDTGSYGKVKLALDTNTNQYYVWFKIPKDVFIILGNQKIQ